MTALPPSLRGKRRNIIRGPEPKTVSGYQLYVADWYANLSWCMFFFYLIIGRKLCYPISSAWKALSDEETQKYRDQATKKNNEVIDDFMKVHGASRWAVIYLHHQMRKKENK